MIIDNFETNFAFESLTGDPVSHPGVIIDPGLVCQLANELYKDRVAPGVLKNRGAIRSTDGSSSEVSYPRKEAALGNSERVGLEVFPEAFPVIAGKLPEEKTINSSGDFQFKPNPAYYFLKKMTPREAGPSEAMDLNVAKIRKDFPILQQRVNGKPLIWLDNAATTQKPEKVIDALTQYYRKYNSNIHRGSHTLANRATDAYESARNKLRDFLGAGSSEEIIFVRGTTEAINLVAQSYGRKIVCPGDEILVSEMEHHSNIVPWQILIKERNAVIKVIPINDRGEIILEEYQKLLSPRTKIVAITHVSNVLGTINPIRPMIESAHRQGATVLIDGAQAVPHLKVDVRALDADFYAFSGHKIFGPTGIGALYGKRALLESMPPWQGGGGMIKKVTWEETTYNKLPDKFEAGTGNIADAIGLGAAVDYLHKIGLPYIERYERGLTEYAMKALATIPGLCLIGTSPEKVGALSFIVTGIEPEALGRYLDQEGIAVRAGHHCAQPVLQRFMVSSAVRASLAMYNTREEIDKLVEVIKNEV